MSDLLRSLQARGVLSPLDRHFAAALAQLVPEAPEEVLLAAALTSRAVQHGHVCADLARICEAGLVDAEDRAVTDVELPEPEAWRTLLAASPLVGDGEASTPLVLEEPARLYMRRYADYQAGLAAHLSHRAASLVECDGPRLRDGLVRFFGDVRDGTPDLQRRAGLVAVQRRLAVISGGPGTGKTTTVVRILALIQEQAVAAGREPLRILMLAPTGKAAQRLGESVEAQVDGLDCPNEIRDSIPTTASTIHRALGWQPRTPTRFRHDAAHPLAADLVLVDEASMVDLALMAKLVAAVPEEARLILLGDRDQLASVEAGAIFGDVCASGDADGFSAEFATRTEELTGESLPVAERAASGIGDGIVHLTQSYRYAAGSGIDRVARAVNAGDADGVLDALRSGADDLQWFEANAAGLRAALAPSVTDGFAGLAEVDPVRRLESLARFRVLCAHRAGALGAADVNTSIESWLEDAGVFSAENEWFDGRPVMVVRNDYQLELFNGDVGVVAVDSKGRRRAFFLGDEGVRSFVPARLPPHETVFATTVHKSQGSEFEHVVLVLPESVSPILTRELLYTGITRARKQLTIVGAEAVIRAGVERRIDRASGLGERLVGQ